MIPDYHFAFTNLVSLEFSTGSSEQLDFVRLLNIHFEVDRFLQ